MKNILQKDNLTINLGDAKSYYGIWPQPTIILSDGPYGISSFPGDPPTVDSLVEWYEPHVKQWSENALPSTTLWFWNTEIGWATIHPLLKKYGWIYKSCNIWNKGIAHIAGNTNTKSLSRLPNVSEVCVQYIRNVKLKNTETNKYLQLKEWLREEWKRTGLPLQKTNEACGVKNAATRKYFTKDHLWYFPPPSAFEKLVHYANVHGKKSGYPYFSIDGKKSLTKDEWILYEAKFKCPIGVTNIWNKPAVRGKEREKNGYKAIHVNQKPISLMELIIKASSDEGDVIWEPFGGLCTAGIVGASFSRKSFCAEINNEFYEAAVARAEKMLNQSKLPLFSEYHSENPQHHLSLAFETT